MEWDRNKILSLLVSLVSLAVALIWGEAGDWLLFIGYLVMPLGCIWFSEEVGGFTGIGAKGIHISTKTPGILILIIGWVLLFMPVITVGIVMSIPIVE